MDAITSTPNKKKNGMTSSDNRHHEIHFHRFIVEYLAAHGWMLGDGEMSKEDAELYDRERYDRANAIYPQDILDYVRATQPEKAAALDKTWGDRAGEQIVKRAVATLEKRGTLALMRKGFDVASGGKLRLCVERPEDERNLDLIEAYKAIRLRVVSELHYAEGKTWAIDLVFFVNGIPIATAELKSDGTQNLEEAIKQYKEARPPRNGGLRHRLLQAKRGALVHFAVSTSAIAFTTELAEEQTQFLPFNQGYNEGEGNPPAAGGKYQTAYLWEEILQRDNFLRLINRFIMIKEAKDGSFNVVFPRYHQWQAVNQLVETIADEGVGKRYLIQHSTGSGKTHSISWVCHELIRLREPGGGKYFDSVIVVTDRTVLDDQLQRAIMAMDHQYGNIEAIDQQRGGAKSSRLAEALKSNAPIIIVTLQTFPFAMKLISGDNKLADNRYAVIVDEAHTSQTGTAATDLRKTLGIDDDGTPLEIAEKLTRSQKGRLMPDHVSYLAFTATPKHSTLTLFGRCPDPTKPAGEDNLPRPFHIYSMQQAIQEGFILDVLKNYMPYKMAYQLELKAEEKNKRVDTKEAKRKIAKWKDLHETNVTQKAEIIVEHFRKNIRKRLDGQAKAMVVTSSRAAAVQFKRYIDSYLKENRIKDVHTLVAFSGTVKGEDVNADLEGKDFSESSMNPNLYGQSLTEAFDGQDYQLMIVANKFQTGFDQPKLMAMYLDKKVSGIDAVQTLSRLNRVHPKKDKAFVLDFANDPDEILQAFRMFFKEACMTEAQDPNVVYDIKAQLDEAGIYVQKDIDVVAEVLMDKAYNQADLFQKISAPRMEFERQFDEQQRLRSEALETFDHAHEAGDLKGQASAEKQRELAEKKLAALSEFKRNLRKFATTYEYIAQIIFFDDAALEAFSSFARLLSKVLDDFREEDIDLTGLELAKYKIEEEGVYDLGLSAPSNREIPEQRPISELGSADPKNRHREFMQEIISKLNILYGSDEFSDEAQLGFVNGIKEIVSQHPALLDQMLNNDWDIARQGDIIPKVTEAVIEQLDNVNGLGRATLDDSESIGKLAEIIYLLIRYEKENAK